MDHENSSNHRCVIPRKKDWQNQRFHELKGIGFNSVSDWVNGTTYDANIYQLASTTVLLYQFKCLAQTRRFHSQILPCRISLIRAEPCRKKNTSHVQRQARFNLKGTTPISLEQIQNSSISHTIHAVYLPTNLPHKSTKCRQIYHTWMVWVMRTTDSLTWVLHCKTNFYDFSWIYQPNTFNIDQTHIYIDIENWSSKEYNSDLPPFRHLVEI